MLGCFISLSKQATLCGRAEGVPERAVVLSQSCDEAPRNLHIVWILYFFLPLSIQILKDDKNLFCHMASHIPHRVTSLLLIEKIQEIISKDGLQMNRCFCGYHL